MKWKIYNFHSIFIKVGKDFLSKYGFFELIGPTGHYETSEMALYINF